MAEVSNIYAGAGLLSYNMMKFTSSSSGEKNTFGTLYPEIGLAYRGVRFAPWINYTFLGKGNKDNSATTSVLNLAAPYLLYLSKSTQFKVGLGLAFYFVKGKGGSLEYHGTYTKPGKSSTAKYFFWDFGLGFDCTDKIRLDVDVLVAGIMSSRRTASSQLHLSHAF